jgi:hypothetical protein
MKNDVFALGRVALVRTDVSEGLSASFIRVIRISELGTTLAVTSNRRTLRRNPDGGAKFLRNVGSYMSHTALHPRRRRFFKGHKFVCLFRFIIIIRISFVLVCLNSGKIKYVYNDMLVQCEL